ncbi:hypothetical protein M413DRAFT_448396 [Hebeloma cylindrosporum]|uniref:Ras-domain-containing protein n=1 Tax=Hebeloma cylindrosporum TaxID=76867 RepID=A0A0C3C1Y2_HEBCY|nr:hypothetical protein M413DRAFT_448396 [Hebeloma cylindrosporum h7]
MPTVKLVVIGASGVGKTSLRGKYISGRFSNGYRATIGADFISKTLPHPTQEEQTVTLQIWDTAGQERFSSLSTAFFRGADAALLMFDVNNSETMLALKKWWADFCDKAPLADEDMNDYCCVVVGNKIDKSGKNAEGLVSESEALEFVDELLPLSASRSPSEINILPPSSSNGSPVIPYTSLSSTSTKPTVPFPSTSQLPRSSSVAITPQGEAKGASPNHSRELSHSPRHQLSKSRSRSSSRFYAGTMTTTHTTLTIYHTPSSSMFDVYQSARSSPEPWSRSTDQLDSLALPHSPPTSVRRRTATMLSTGSASSGSAVTITPSLFARENANGNAKHSPPLELAPAPAFVAPLPPERGPKLFFTSAKTGEGVADVFEYIAQRVIRKWEYEEWMEARTMHFREASGRETIRLEPETWNKKKLTDCCA